VHKKATEEATMMDIDSESMPEVLILESIKASSEEE